MKLMELVSRQRANPVIDITPTTDAEFFMMLALQELWRAIEEADPAPENVKVLPAGEEYWWNFKLPDGSPRFPLETTQLASGFAGLITIADALRGRIRGFPTLEVGLDRETYFHASASQILLLHLLGYCDAVGALTDEAMKLVFIGHTTNGG